jgi:hypothetical protein
MPLHRWLDISACFYHASYFPDPGCGQIQALYEYIYRADCPTTTIQNRNYSPLRLISFDLISSHSVPRTTFGIALLLLLVFALNKIPIRLVLFAARACPPFEISPLQQRCHHRHHPPAPPANRLSVQLPRCPFVGTSFSPALHPLCLLVVGRHSFFLIPFYLHASIKRSFFFLEKILHRHAGCRCRDNSVHPSTECLDSRGLPERDPDVYSLRLYGV